MAHKTAHLYGNERTFKMDKWMSVVVSIFHRWHEKNARKQDIKRLLASDERFLDDIGLQRTELVSELGYDPHEVPPMYGASVYPNPYIGYQSTIKKNHARRR